MLTLLLCQLIPILSRSQTLTLETVLIHTSSSSLTCQSSSVTKGMKGCRSLSPASRQTQSVLRVASLAAVAPGSASSRFMTGFISSMKTSQRSYCQKLYRRWVAVEKSYVSIACRKFANSQKINGLDRTITCYRRPIKYTSSPPAGFEDGGFLLPTISQRTLTVADTAPSSRDRIHLEGKGYPGSAASRSASDGGEKPSGRFIMANLIAFQSLLHQCRYATTRLMSRLMSRA